MQTLFLKPAVPGSVVRDPETGRILAPSGSTVPNNSYWRRRIADGSAVAVTTRTPTHGGTTPRSASPGAPRKR